MIQHLEGDCRDVLKTLQEQSVSCCITSPPYFGLRSYGIGKENGEIGQEDTPEGYVQNLVEVFRRVRRVLRDDGVIFLNLGDSYFGSGKGQTQDGCDDPKQPKLHGMKLNVIHHHSSLKPKDLIGIPWMVAFALRNDGWYLRCDCIWEKPNCMPDSVKDRPTRSHEYIFLLSKSSEYYYDYESIQEDAVMNRWGGKKQGNIEESKGDFRGLNRDRDMMPEKRNKRSIWTVSTSCYAGSHFAVFPPDLIRPCILAGAPQGGWVLDPFGGSGTTAMVAEQEGRNCILIELNPEYIRLAKKRTAQTSLISYLQ